MGHGVKLISSWDAEKSYNDNLSFDYKSWINNDNCYVYIMQARALYRAKDRDCDLIKVGISGNPWARLSSIKTASPLQIDLIAARRMLNRDIALTIERRMHKRLEECRTSGEWFAYWSCGASIDLDEVITEWCVEDFAAELSRRGMNNSFGGVVELLMFSGINREEANDLVESMYGGLNPTWEGEDCA